MDEEILKALKKAHAVDKESGLTFHSLLERSGVNYDSFLANIRRLREKEMVESSDNKVLMTKAYPDPSGAVGLIEVRSEDYHGAIAKNKTIWAERNHYPLVIWLGDELAQGLLDRKRTDALLEEMKAPRSSVVVQGNNSGQIAQGNDIQQTQQEGDHSSSSQKYKNVKTENRTNKKRNTTLKAIGALVIASLAAYIGGVLLRVF